MSEGMCMLRWPLMSEVAFLWSRWAHMSEGTFLTLS